MHAPAMTDNTGIESHRDTQARLDPGDLRRQPRAVKRRASNPSIHPAGHVALTVAGIGAMSLMLAAGLEMAGALPRLNALVASMVARGGLGEFAKSLPAWGIWLATTGFAFGMSAAILCTSGFTRRLFLWLTAVLLVMAWAPVLALASHRPDIAGPWVAALWSGACAVFYASRHRMPCDEFPADES